MDCQVEDKNNEKAQNEESSSIASENSTLNQKSLNTENCSPKAIDNIIINTESHISELSQNDSTTSKEKDYFPSLQNPHLTDLDYVGKEEVPLHVNLYKLLLTKDYTLYEYSVKFIYSGGDSDKIPTILKKKILTKVASQIKEKCGPFIPIGNAFYSFTKTNENINISVDYHMIKYLLEIRITEKTIEMRKDAASMVKQYIDGSYDIKTIFEIIVREILKHNPSLNYSMYLFGYKDEEKILQAQRDYNDIKIMPGFSTKVMILESGIYLNVDIRTKILSTFNCLELIETFIQNAKNPTLHEINEVNNWIMDKTIETTYSNQRYKVIDVNFDRNPENTTITINNKSITLLNYYKQYYGIDVYPKSPLINARKKKSSKRGEFLPPELCLIVGLDDEKSSDRTLTKEITKVAKLKPSDKVDLTNDILKLINEKKPIIKLKNVNNELKEVRLPTSYEIKEEFCLDLIESSKTDTFKGKVINLPKIVGKKGEINNIASTFFVYEATQIRSICLFDKRDEKIARSLKDVLNASKKQYNLILEKNDFRHVNSDRLEDWTDLIDKCIKVGRYNIITCLLDDQLDNEGFYDQLKKYLQEQKGIVSQFIKTKSLRRNSMSVASNILLQMNSKLGGVSYVINFDKEIKEKNLMIIGVDSSGYEKNGHLFQSISFCATIDQGFGKYTNKKETVEIQNYDNMNYPIASFLEYAFTEYFKMNNKLPGGVIIYRQGISEGQKRYLNYEIEELDRLLSGNINILKNMKVPYYYIIVNKKTSLKFFEIKDFNKENRNNEKGMYENPDNGLLIIDKVVNPDKFEFYIQPQKVSQGTATPTCFQVEYGNMNCPKLLPKLTYYLCFLYSNWRGPVRVPAPLKYAEKLAKSKADVNDEIRNTLSYI